MSRLENDGLADRVETAAIHRNIDTHDNRQTVPPARGASHWPWAVAIMFASGCILTGYIFNHFTHIPADIAKTLGDSLKATTTTTTVIRTAVSELHGVKHLVVLTAKVDAVITKNKETRRLWGKLYLGTTTVEVRATGNQVQFYVPLEDLRSDDFRYDEKRHVLQVTIPRPVLDEQFVDVQTDPSNIQIRTDVGWASLERYEGAFLRDDAIRDLRPQVIKTAKEYPLLLDHASDRGLLVFQEDIVDRLKEALGNDLIAVVNYRQEAPIATSQPGIE